MATFSALVKELSTQAKVNVAEGWCQGRTLYGGATTGLAIEAAIAALPLQGASLRSGHVTFVGPTSDVISFQT